MGFLLKYLKKYKKESIGGPLFKMIEVIFELLVPLVVASIIDKGIAGGDRAHIVKMCIVLVILAAVGLTSTLTAQYLSAKAAVSVSTDMRHDVFRKIQSFSYADADKIGTSVLVTRMTSDINQIQNGLNITLRLLLRSPFVVIGAMVMAFTVDTKAAMVFAVVIPILFAAVFAVILTTIPMFRRVQERLDGVTRTVRENITGTRVIRAFNNQKSENDEFKEENTTLAALQKTAGAVSALMNPVTFLIINVAVIFLIKAGAVRVNYGMLSAGQVVALYNYMSQILVELIKFANVTVSASKALACARRIEAVMNEKGGQEIFASDAVTEAKVEFRNVSLTYNAGAECALNNINFTVKSGETIGITGGTGCGKSSVVNLIPRFYDATSGTVFVNGRDVKSFDTGELRKKIGVVPQKAALFSGTIRENLLWAKEDATDEEIMEAVRTAQAEDVIKSKPDGLDEKISKSTLSGGQKQRLTIARALVGKPDILILDDSSSALDYATDFNLRQAIAALPWKPTVFIVSQRISSVMGCDKILLLEDGHQAGFAPHDELYKNVELYREICDIQLSD